MLTLYRPYKLERKILSEKAGANRYVVLKRTKDIKMIKFKRIFSLILSGLLSISISYATGCIMTLDNNMFFWSFGERLVFLLSTVLAAPLIMHYCGRHMIYEEDIRRQEYFNIALLSENWFKKFLSLIIMYVFTALVFYIVFAFCNFNFDLSEIKYVVRVIISLLIYLITMILAVIAHNDSLRILLNIKL